MISVAGLPPVALALSFAAFDWLMSLAPTWVSTMFPVYVVRRRLRRGDRAAHACCAFAAERAGHPAGLNASRYYALGRLLLAFTIFWAYAAFFQLLLIWIANRPEEVGVLRPPLPRPVAVVSFVLVLCGS